MQQWRFWWYFCVVALLLLSGSTANGYVDVPGTAITLNWESPVDGQEISGVQTFRGFAYSRTPSTPLTART